MPTQPLEKSGDSRRIRREAPVTRGQVRVEKPACAPSQPSVVPQGGPAKNFDSLLCQLAPALGQLAARYPEVADEVIRQQTVDVLCLAQGNQVNATLVVRLVETRIIALL